MFTGIVEEVGKVVTAVPGKLVVNATRVLNGMNLGDSIAVNGVCLTIASLTSGSFSASVMPETFRRSNLGRLRSGDHVNLERPLALNGWVGGHLVQGHVDATGKVTGMKPESEAMLISFQAPAEVLYYIVEKGFITIDGISLTVAYRDDTSFQVSIVDYSRHHTNLMDRHPGDIVNIEIDIIAKYVARFTQVKSPGITLDFLKEQGFGVN
jgi:riboflavin synthase